MRQAQSLPQFKPSSNCKEVGGGCWIGSDRTENETQDHPLAGEEAS